MGEKPLPGVDVERLTRIAKETEAKGLEDLSGQVIMIDEGSTQQDLTAKDIEQLLVENEGEDEQNDLKKAA